MIGLVLLTLGALIAIAVITVGSYFLGSLSPKFILLGVTLVMLLYVIILALMTFHRIISL